MLSIPLNNTHAFIIASWRHLNNPLPMPKSHKTEHNITREKKKPTENQQQGTNDFSHVCTCTYYLFFFRFFFFWKTCNVQMCNTLRHNGENRFSLALGSFCEALLLSPFKRTCVNRIPNMNIMLALAIALVRSLFFFFILHFYFYGYKMNYYYSSFLMFLGQ